MEGEPVGVSVADKGGVRIGLHLGGDETLDVGGLLVISGLERRLGAGAQPGQDKTCEQYDTAFFHFRNV